MGDPVYPFRLASPGTGVGAESYTYDAGDDPTQIVNATGTQNQSFDDASRLTTISDATQTPTATLAYDAQGNRTGIDSVGGSDTGYAYDQAGRLTTFSGPGPAGTTVSESYGYDGSGLRQYVDDATNRTHESWDSATGIPTLIQDRATSYIYGPTGTPIEQISPTGVTSYFHADQLGSTRALTDQTGHPVATYTYTPYGRTATSTGTLANPFQYAGQYTDATGLQYLRARYYDPTTAQFLTVDPAVDQTGAAYGYAASDPANATDPTGLDACSAAPTDSVAIPRCIQVAAGVIPVAIATGAALQIAEQAVLSAANENGDATCPPTAAPPQAAPPAEGADPGAPAMTQWGWSGSPSYRKAVEKVAEGGTHEEIFGKVPTEGEARRLIHDADGGIDRIGEGPHQPPNPHQYPHANYHTDAVRGTLKVDEG